MNISYHAWKAFTECPKKFHLEFLKKAPPTVPINDYFKLYGLSVQKFFEMFCNVWRYHTPFLPPDMIREKLNAIYEDILKTSTINWSAPFCKLGRNDIFEEAFKDIYAIMESPNQNYFLNTRSEISIELTLKDSNTINGRLDFIHNDAIARDRDTIIDGKGSNKIGKNIDDNQILFYSLLYSFKFNKPPAEAGFFYYRFNTFVPVPVDEKNINEFRARLSLDIKKIITSDYKATPSAKSCKYCNYMEGCLEGLKAKAARAKKSKLDMEADGIVTFSP